MLRAFRTYNLLAASAALGLLLSLSLHLVHHVCMAGGDEHRPKTVCCCGAMNGEATASPSRTSCHPEAAHDGPSADACCVLAETADAGDQALRAKTLTLPLIGAAVLVPETVPRPRVRRYRHPLLSSRATRSVARHLLFGVWLN